MRPSSSSSSSAFSFSPQAISLEWHQSPEGEGVLAHVTDPITGLRKQYGLLERPLLPPTAQTISFKLFLAGKTGVGKTSLVSLLSGAHPTAGSAGSAGETPGLRVTNVFWPTSIRAQIVLFNLALWDAGEVACKKYGHIQPVSRESAGGGLFVFSFQDRNSFDEVGNLLSRLNQHPGGTTVCPIVVGTRFGAVAETEVTQQDVAQFESKWRRPVLRIRNFPTSTAGGPSQQQGRYPSPTEIALVLNIICDQLFCHHHPQHPRSPQPAVFDLEAALI